MRFFDSCDQAVLLTNAESRKADMAAVEAGRSLAALMEAAGRAVAEVAWLQFRPRRVLVLAGPGNNGGDAYVAADHLRRMGVAVTITSLAAAGRESAEAGAARERVEDLPQLSPEELLAESAGPEAWDLVIDGLFGAGLSRPLAGPAAALVRWANDRACRRLAIDIPSGVQGDDGAVLGEAIRADVTVTFFRRKRGHLLMPGRSYCGRIAIAEIGIPDTVLADIAPRVIANDPGWWQAFWPRWPLTVHKYARGSLLVIGGRPPTLGAARLAARAGLRVGAGIVTLATPREAWAVQAAALETVLVAPFDHADELADRLSDPRLKAVVFGPGAGRDEWTRRLVTLLRARPRPTVLDADALSAFASRPEDLFALLDEDVVLTPHEGEFARLFPDLATGGSKIARAQEAARRAGAVVLLKGADTVIAHPGGTAVVDAADCPQLATGGSGDILSGLIGGLMAQGLPAMLAATIGQWLLKTAAGHFGRGMIASDLLAALPAAMAAVDRPSRPDAGPLPHGVRWG